MVIGIFLLVSKIVTRIGVIVQKGALSDYQFLVQFNLPLVETRWSEIYHSYVLYLLSRKCRRTVPVNPVSSGTYVQTNSRLKTPRVNSHSLAPTVRAVQLVSQSSSKLPRQIFSIDQLVDCLPSYLHKKYNKVQKKDSEMTRTLTPTSSLKVQFSIFSSKYLLLRSD